MAKCKGCGESEHVYACNRPPFVSVETWQAMTDDQRLAAEEEAESRGYMWTDGSGWVRVRMVRAKELAAQAVALDGCRATPTDRYDGSARLFRITADDGSWSGLYRPASLPMSRYLTLVEISDGNPPPMAYVTNRDAWRAIERMGYE